MSGFRPLLGWNKPYDIEDVALPCLVSAKLDGWRAWPLGNELFSRSFKTIPNRNLQMMFRGIFGQIANWDGELIAGDPGTSDAYNRTDKILKAHYADASTIRYYVFDNFTKPDDPFWKRLESIGDLPPLVIKLDQVVCRTHEEILEQEQKALDGGFEGLCIRSPTGRYKYGRSTFNEQYLLKLKRFLDAEATVVGFNEAMHNGNEATKNSLGLTERSSHLANQIPMGVLGSLTVEMGGVQFRVGTGFDQADRREIWNNRDKYLGKLVRIKYSPTVKDRPRQPRWLGWRSDL